MSLNRVTVMGRITRDIELRWTRSEKAVTSFSIAVAPDRNDGETDFFDVTVWGKTAEFAAKYLGKGRNIVVDGRLSTRQWEDKDGNKRKSVEIIANSLYFADSKKEDAGNGGTWQELEDSDDFPF